MKILKSTILIIGLLLSVSVTDASERVSISATATVIPALGVMSISDNLQILSITQPTNSKLFIQAPKNSTLQIHLERAGESYNYPKTLSSSTKSNSISDLYTIDFLANQPPQILTIIRIDN